MSVVCTKFTAISVRLSTADYITDEFGGLFVARGSHGRRGGVQVSDVIFGSQQCRLSRHTLAAMKYVAPTNAVPNPHTKVTSRQVRAEISRCISSLEANVALMMAMSTFISTMAFSIPATRDSMAEALFAEASLSRQSQAQTTTTNPSLYLLLGRVRKCEGEGVLVDIELKRGSSCWSRKFCGSSSHSDPTAAAWVDAHEGQIGSLVFSNPLGPGAPSLTYDCWLYLAVVLDLFSRQMVDWSMSLRIDRGLAMNALLMDVWRRQPKKYGDGALGPGKR